MRLPSSWGALLGSALCAAALSGCAAEPAAQPEPAPATPTPAPEPKASPTPRPPASAKRSPEADALALAQALAAAGELSFKDFMRARKAEASPEELRRKARQAKLDVHRALDAYNEALDPLRDDEGLLPRQYEAHEATLQTLATYLIDLEKLSPRD